ncbi:MAG: FAD-dependent oxidoreductase [Candidatus Moraniibacteriota bacterium]
MANSLLKFKSKVQVADGTWSFFFEKPADFTFEAGQYVALVLPRLIVPDKRGPVRSLSICSAPNEPELVFSVRITDSGFKQTLMALEPGEVAQATKPIGHFTLSHATDNKRVVFLAGGIGVTPIRSILVESAHVGLDRPFSFFYSNRMLKDAAFHEELKMLTLPNYQYVTTFSQETIPCVGGNDERGYICEAMLRKYLSADDITTSWYYLAGAPAFIEAMEKALVDMGVSKERFVNDPFTGLTPANQVTK